MRRVLLVAAVALLGLGALPVVPMAAAQAAPPPAMAVVYSDDFTTASWTSSSGPGNVDGEWHSVIDGTGADARKGWYAGRATSTGDAAGYSDSTNVRLTSPALAMPEGWIPRSLAVTLRGSSEAGADLLTVEWAPIVDAPDSQWRPMGSFSGADLQDEYRVRETTAGSFQDHRGPFFVRLRFTADAACDSDPEPGTLPGPAGMLDAGTEPCGGIGWFVDRVDLVARRDFTALAEPGAPRVPVEAGAAAVAIDLLADAGKLLEFRLDPGQVTVPAGVDSMLVRLDRQASADLIDLAATRGANGTWTAVLAIDEPDLVRGAWDVQFFGTQGGSGSLLATSLLTVRVQDTVVPRLSATPTGNPVQLGPGQAMALEVTEAFLRSITYTFEGLPQPVDLPFPYTIPVSAFPEGPSKVSFRAEDRAGNVAILEANVERDTTRPAVTVMGPANVYAGVPFGLSVVVAERSAHTIRVDVNGTVIDFAGAAGEAAAGKTHVLQVTPPGTGELTVTTRVIDALGNEGLTVREFIAVLPVADLRVNQVKLATPATNTANEGHGIVAVVEQVGGVAPLPVTVTFEAGGRSQAYTVTVPASGPFEVRWDTKLPPGMNAVKVHAAGPAVVNGTARYNETLPGNENGTAAIESFLGRITIGSKVYSIRADARGLPTTAVLSGTSKAYPLTLAQTGSGVQYQFTADGNRTVLWDPLDPVLELEAAATSTTPAGKDAPFPGLLMALAVLALAALGQRRKA